MGIISWSEPGTAAFGFAAAVLLLVLIGIHNAWDMVSYMMAERIRPSGE